VSKINNQYLLTFIYEETLNCLKSRNNKTKLDKYEMI